MDYQNEKEKVGHEEPPKTKILLDSIRTTLKKVPNWKTPGHEIIHRNVFQKINIYPRRTGYRKWIDEAKICEWMTKGKTTLIQTDSQKPTVHNNYRSLRCLTIMKRKLKEKET